MLVLPAFEASETSTALAAAAGAFCPSVTSLPVARSTHKLVQPSSHLRHACCAAPLQQWRDPHACTAFDGS